MSQVAPEAPPEPTPVPADPAPEPQAVAPEPTPVPDPDPAPVTPPTAAPADPAPEPEPDPEPAWAEDWREKIAEHASAGNKQEYEKELKRLERVTDPAALYGMYRELENRFRSGRLVKMPDENSSDDEIQDFLGALGVPEKPEDYMNAIDLGDNRQFGDEDQELVNGFLQAAHEVGAPPHVVNRVMNWYFDNMEQQAAHYDEIDTAAAQEYTDAMTQAYGAAATRYANGVVSMFAEQPGGTDLNNPDSLVYNIMNARMPNGSLVGSNVQFAQMMAGLAEDQGLTITNTDGGLDTRQAIQSELEEIKKTIKTNRREYDKDPAMQDRFKELLAAEARANERAQR